MQPRALASTLLVLAGLCVASRAPAATADELFTEGLKLFDAGRVHEACERFEASLRLDPALGTLQNLATCHEQDGRTARAYAEFNELADRAAKAGITQKARETLGRQHAAALAKKLSKVEIRLGPGANVQEIRIDDIPLARNLWVEPVALDPGPHTLVFSAPGKVPATRPLDVSAAPGVVPFDVPLLADVPVAAPPPRPTVPLRPIGIAVGSVGALGLVLGTVFGGLTFADKGAAGSHCTGKYCDAQGLSLQDSAHHYATASTTTFVLGVAAVGAGAFLFFWRGKQPPTALRVTPALSASTAGLRADASF